MSTLPDDLIEGLQGLFATLEAARKGAKAGSAQHAILARLANLTTALQGVTNDEVETPRKRGRAEEFLAHLLASHEDLGPRLFQPAFTLNVVGEAYVRSGFLSRSVDEFLQIGLYFYGQEQIERRFGTQADAATAVHFEYLEGFLGRDALKSMVREGRERIAEGRVFCLTYFYVNGLRKRAWAYAREHRDALDLSMDVDAAPEPSLALPEAGTPSPTERAALLLDVFRHALDDRQRWIYVAKNRAGILTQQTELKEALGAESWGELLGGMTGSTPRANLKWKDIAARLELNEKTVKREYLRALHALLLGVTEATFGAADVPEGSVRTILDQLQTVIGHKDLRLRGSTGRGIGPLVARWEVALRFVLGHELVSSPAAG